ncbi:craniofacial development protein 2-like [Anneissia japonica]|uniref:craniofacial development protein 2-like n=1 Tax=Anneissia japonica TaxID=1529436 RepID=UPI0014258FC2|nr:craniofacial development protein 2-like [Anneissia japonica]
MENDLIIGGSIFKHKDIHKETWVSPTGKTKNQIDHITINRKWRTSLQEVKAERGADVGSDHHLLASQIKLKLRKTSNKKPEILFNTQRLRDPVTRNIFEINLKNSFEVLEELPTEDIESGWTKFKQAFTETSSLVLGQKKKAWKTWMTPKSWNLIEERKKLKQEILSRKGNFMRDNKYKRKNKQVKKSVKEDKQQFFEEQTKEAEKAANRGDLGTLYKITKSLIGSYQINSSSTVKGKHGTRITKQEEVSKRWKEHFQEVLNSHQSKRGNH